MTPRAAIVGIAGLRLSAEEAALFRAAPPAGAILFARNICDPDQLRALIADLRDVLGPDAPLLVDQEGGRVARLRPPHWPAFPPAAAFEGLPAEAARANAALIGLACREMGFDVVCAPVLDLRLAGAHSVIGDRAFSAEPREVTRLGRAWCEGLQAAGIQPVLKHIPGHGRALADSHLELPRVEAPRSALGSDLAPFADLADVAGAWAMTAHILYQDLDPVLPATLSPGILRGLIRGELGFQGVLVGDDLGMKALSGAPAELACAALAAGCDLVLHCSGRLEETAALLAGCPPLRDESAALLAEARARAEQASVPLDAEALRQRRDVALCGPILAVGLDPTA